MTAASRIAMPGQIWRLAAGDPAGPLYVTGYGSDPLKTVLTAVDPGGRVLWQRNFSGTGRPWSRVGEHGTVWIARPEATWHVLEEIDAEGRTLNTVVPPCQPGEDIGTFVLLPDGFCIAWTATPPMLRGAAPLCEPRVARYTSAGHRLWSTPVRLGELSYPGVIELSESNGWKPQAKRPWTPRGVRSAHHEPLLVSGDRVAASFEDSSGLGRTFLLDLDTGHTTAVTAPAPGGHKAIADDGGFLIGAHGYGADQTVRVTRDGITTTRWPSHGALTATADGAVRVVQMRNELPSRSAFRQLLPTGALLKGPHLPGYYTAPPATDTEGTTVFWRDNTLTAIDTDMTPHHLHTIPGTGITTRTLILDDGLVALALDGDLHLLPTPLGPLATGPWPCADHNLRGNPAHQQPAAPS